jgi:hypothetical protein
VTFTITGHHVLVTLGVCGLLALGGFIGFVYASLRMRLW